MKNHKILSTLVIIALMIAGTPVMSADASGMATVKPGDVGVSWSTNDTRPGGSSSFVSGPSIPPAGTGSLQFTTTDTMGGSSQAKAQLFNYNYMGSSLSDMEALSYWAYRSSISTNSLAQTVSLNIEVDFEGDGSSYTTLVFEPIYQPGGVGVMLLDTWQQWDAIDAGNAIWWSTKDIPGVCAFNCFVSWNTILANNPDAKVKYAVGFNVGSGWVGEYLGAVDLLEVGMAGDTTTYDFEPETLCTTVCYADVVNGNDAFGGDTPASAKKTIQAAIDQVDPGGMVIIAAGIYDENLDIAKPLTIQGAGHGTNSLVDTIIDPSGGLYGAYIHQPVNLKNLRITGAPSQGIRVQSLGGRLAFANVTWENIASSFNGDRGVELHNGTDVTNMAIINSEFVGNAGQGIRSASDVTIDGLTITGSLFNQNSWGIYLQGTINNLKLLGSSINDNTNYGAYMTETGALTGLTVEGSEFINNSAGMMIWNEKDNSDITITGTTFQGNGAWGVIIWGNSLTNVLIQDSQVLNNDGLGLGYYGVDFNTYAGVMDNVAVHYTNITGQSMGNGLKNRNAVNTAQINATCNWWGAADGPSGTGDGSGDAVTDFAAYVPWLVAAAPGGSCTGMPDNEGPITSGALASPNPAAINVPVNLTAVVDDTVTGGSNIASAEYSLDGNTWYPMSASDGSFDEISENIAAGFTAPGTPGIYNLCVRGTDVRGNTGVAECIMFVVYDPSGGFVTGGGWIDSPSSAMTPITTLVWDQGFEAGIDGWVDANTGWYGAVTRVPSGTSGISASNGAYYAIFQGDATSGPFTRFDGFRNVWPGVWTAEVDVYLDPAWISGQGFDYSVAATGSDGAHQRDFIFHVTRDTSTGKLFVAGSNNTNFAPREDLENINHYEVVSAGWYTLQHIFRDQGGALAVDLNLLDTNGNILFSETRYTATDLIPDEVGGNRYGWFTFINVAGGIAVDENQLFVPVSPTGKATFGFVSKYKKGTSIPEGNTEFQFKAGGLNFHSTSYEWLVITGGNYARFKGEGTINGQGNYKFMIWAGDDSPDTFRIKIWYEEGGNEVVVYDNGMNQPIGGGSIVVHTK